MRRRSTQSVTLFPFLAVLVCAMGALIFLLLVTTRRIRSDAIAQIQQQQVEEPEEEIRLPAKPAEPDETSVPLPTDAVSDIADVQPNAAESPLQEVNTTSSAEENVAALATPTEPEDVPAEEPAMVFDPTADPFENLSAADYAADIELPDAAQIPIAPAPADPNVDLQAEIDALKNDGLARQKRLAQQQADVATAQAELTRSEKQLQAAQQAAVDAEQKQRQTQAQQNEQQKQIDRARQNIAEAKERAKTARAQQPVESKFAFIPYDGVTGTARRPIMIECSAAGFRFVPEGTVISKSDLTGFTQQFNPLLAGANALIRFWRDKDASQATETFGDPYVLLIVRPSGTLHFYAARAALEALSTEHGYELVTQDFPLNLPPADKQAQELVQREVDRVLNARADMERKLAREIGRGYGSGGRAGSGDGNGGRRISIGQNGRIEIYDADEAGNASSGNHVGRGLANRSSDETGYGSNGRRGSATANSQRSGNEGSAGKTGPPGPPGSSEDARREFAAEFGQPPTTPFQSLRNNRLPSGAAGRRATTGNYGGNSASELYGNNSATNKPSEIGTGTGTGQRGTGSGSVSGQRNNNENVGETPKSAGNSFEEFLARSQASQNGTANNSTGDSAAGNSRTPATETITNGGGSSSAAQNSGTTNPDGNASYLDALLAQQKQRGWQGTNPTGRPPNSAQQGQRGNSSAGSADANLPGMPNFPQFGVREPEANQPPQQSRNPFQSQRSQRLSRGMPSSPGGSSSSKNLSPQQVLEQLQRGQRRWGNQKIAGAIGFERTLTLHVDGQQMWARPPAAMKKSTAHANAVASAEATPDTPTKQLVADAAHLIDATVSQWDTAPRGFFWIPIVRFDVQREGEPVFRRLRRPLERLGLQVEAPDAPRIRTISRSKTRSNP